MPYTEKKLLGDRPKIHKRKITLGSRPNLNKNVSFSVVGVEYILNN